ncbi:MAG: iron ABC transporter permease [Kofleriaceae bacterium]
MSFVGGSARLTRARWIAVMTMGLVVVGLLLVLAPLVGPGHDGRGVALMSPSALWGDGVDATIFWNVRLPRTLAAALVGAALAAAGCAFQAVLRNPLAEPFTLGVSSGASLAAVIAIRLGVASVLGTAGVGAAAVVGAVAAVALVWQLGRVGSSLPPATLILAGVTVSMFCSAAALVVQTTADFAEISRMLRWMMGGLEWTQLATVLRALPAVALGAAVLLWQGRDLNALAAGDEAAASVGVAVGRAQTLAFAAASLLVGTSIAIAGPVGFVGLIVPHALRAMVGPDHRVLVPMSLVGGAALVVVCDTVARMLGQLPVGVVTALAGGPFFLMLLVRGKRGSALWRGE